MYMLEWKLKARVTKKSAKRTWSNSKGTGTLFNIEMLDKAGTQIQATFFKDAADLFYEKIHENGVFLFSNGKVQLANQKFTSIKNDFALVFDKNSEIVEIKEDDQAIQETGFTFTPLSEIQQIEQMKTIDVVGLVQEVGPCQSVNLKSGQSKDRRNVTLVDNSGENGTSISVTFWSGNARLTTFSSGQVIAIKGARVSCYNGKSLNCGEEHS